MVRKMLLLAALCVLVLPAVAQDAPPKPEVKAEYVELKGVVLDAGGKAVADATVASRWNVKEGAWTSKDGVKTDAEGKFSLKVRMIPEEPDFPHPHPYRVQAHDAAGKLGVLAVLKAADLKSEQKLTLRPLVEVSAKLLDPEGAKAPESFYANIIWAARNTFVVCDGVFKGNAFSFKLPQGDYRYSVSAADCEFVAGTFKLDGGKDRLELGPIQLQLTTIAKMAGRPAAPIAISHVRNLPADLADKGAKVTLADFKGRWVMLEFWGYW